MAFIVLPLDGKRRAKKCKKDCSKCKLWHCPKWHEQLENEAQQKSNLSL